MLRVGVDVRTPLLSIIEKSLVQIYVQASAGWCSGGAETVDAGSVAIDYIQASWGGG